MKFSEIPTGTPFSGTVVSRRSGDTIHGYFIKQAGQEACLLENAWDQMQLVHTGEAPYCRFIRPECIVFVLFAHPPLPPGTIPILLDDLDVKNYREEVIWFKATPAVPCSKDTDGDRNCGRPACSECGNA